MILYGPYGPYTIRKVDNTCPTYWKHEFWIVQIPEYITDESGFIDNPDNINSRQYNKSGSYLGSQDHLGDTYYTRYEQTIQNQQVSKLKGTKYNYLPAIHRADATFLSLSSPDYYSNRPPLLYLFHKYLNPLTDNIESGTK